MTNHDPYLVSYRIVLRFKLQSRADVFVTTFFGDEEMEFSTYVYSTLSHHGCGILSRCRRYSPDLVHHCRCHSTLAWRRVYIDLTY